MSSHGSEANLGILALPQVHGQAKLWLGLGTASLGGGSSGGSPRLHWNTSGCRPHSRRGLLSSRMVLRGVSAVSIPLWWPCPLRGQCPCMLGITWWHREAQSHLCQAEGPCLVLCPFPPPWLLQRAPGQSRPPSVTVCVPSECPCCPSCAVGVTTKQRAPCGV